jgi:ATP-dependent protease ClpP protease subunit
MAVCTEILEQLQPEALYFSFSSPGGNVAAGITLYSFLRGLPIEIIMHNTGSVDSIATAIFLAGDKRYACQHSTFLFHGVAVGVQQAANLTLSTLRELISGVEQDENKIIQIMTNRTNLSDSELRELFRVGEAKPPIFAESKGIVHSIRDLNIPRNAKLISLNIP